MNSTNVNHCYFSYYPILFSCFYCILRVFLSLVKIFGNMSVRLIHKYTEKALNDLMNLGIRATSRKLNVPRGTIQDRLHGRLAEVPRRTGPSTILPH